MARPPAVTGDNGRTPAGEELAHAVVAFDDNRLMPELFGEFDQNLARIEQRLGVDAVARGNQVSLRGGAEALNRARLALDILYGRLQKGHQLSAGDVDGAIRMAEAADDQLSLPSLELKGRLGPDLGAAEELRDALLGVHFTDESAEALAGALQGEGSGERRLADASFAGHHEETFIGQFFDHG